MGFTLRKAERRKAKARIALTGPSGAGKTMSALLLARGMAEALGLSGESAIGLIDSERGSAELYAHVVPFTVLDLTPPYSPQRYMEAIAFLEQHKFPIIIIDQISHAWAGEGGLLERVDNWKGGSKNGMSAWQQATPEQQRFVDAMLRSTAHIIATMRSKTEWVIEPGKAPKKVGLAPIQRDGIEYEFTSVLDIDIAGHSATASKDRTGLFDEKRTLISEATGRALVQWLNEGGPERFEAAERERIPPAPTPERARQIAREHPEDLPPPKPPQADPPGAGFGDAPDAGERYGAALSAEQITILHAKIGEKAKRLGVAPAAIKAKILAEYNIKSSKELGQTVWNSVLTMILRLKTADLAPKVENCPECSNNPCAASCSLQGAQPPAA